MTHDSGLKTLKHAYITGTSRGLGKALAEVLLEEEWSVTGIARNQALEHSAYRHVQADLSEPWQQWLPAIFEDHSIGSTLLLVNNAGALGRVNHIGKLDPADLAQVFNLNVTAPAILMNEFIRRYPQQQKLVMNISSGAGQYPVDGWSAYCSSKAALDMLSEVAALEAGQTQNNKLKVFSVAPGVIDTAMQEQIRQTDQQAFSRVAHFQELKAAQKLAEPKAVARQLMKLIDQPLKFNEVKQDVRKL